MPSYASWDVSLRHSQPWLEAVELGQRIVLRAGQTLFEERRRHRWFYLIHSGYVQASMLRGSGARVLLETYGPGTIFGEGAAFEGAPRFVTCTALADCALDRFDPDTVAQALAQRPQLALSLIRIMSAKQRALATRVAGLSSTTPQVRLCALLRRVAQVEQRQRGGGPPSQVHLTHEELASMTGLSRVTVTRTLARLARQGLLATHPGHVELRDAAAVARLGEID